MDWTKLRIKRAGLIPVWRWNAIVDEIQASRITSFEGGRVSITLDGTTLISNDADEADEETHPLLLMASGDDGIRVIYGTIAGEAPTGMSPGDDPPYIITGLSGTGVIYGAITRNAVTGALTARYIDHAATIPVGTETDGYFEIGSYSITDGVISIAQAVSGSQAYGYCLGHQWGLV